MVKKESEKSRTNADLGRYECLGGFWEDVEVRCSKYIAKNNTKSNTNHRTSQVGRIH